MSSASGVPRTGPHLVALRQVYAAIDQAAATGLNLHVLGHAGSWPIMALSRPAAPGRPTVLVTGGTHGDEPAGVAAALACLAPEFQERWRGLGWHVIPCVNPAGYLAGTRGNAQGADINWSYERDDVPEVRALRDWLVGRRFAFVLDFHEDWESPGYYLYEMRRGGAPVGQQVTDLVRAVCPLNAAETIEGWPARRGVLTPDPAAEPGRPGVGIPVAMIRHHTDHLVVPETPTSLDLDTRVRAHLLTLEVLAAVHAPSPSRGTRAGRLRAAARAASPQGGP